MAALLLGPAFALTLEAALPPFPNTQRNACAGSVASAAAWCKPGPPFAPRASALVANLTRQEKAGLLIMIDQGVPRLGIEPCKKPPPPFAADLALRPPLHP